MAKEKHNGEGEKRERGARTLRESGRKEGRVVAFRTDCSRGESRTRLHKPMTVRRWEKTQGPVLAIKERSAKKRKEEKSISPVGSRILHLV